MSKITIKGTFDNITDAQKALAEINRENTNCLYWTDAYSGNPGIRNQVWGTMGSVYGGQLGGFIGSNMDMLVYNFNNLLVAPLAMSQGIYQPVNYYPNIKNK